MSTTAQSPRPKFTGFRHQRGQPRLASLDLDSESSSSSEEEFAIEQDYASSGQEEFFWGASEQDRDNSDLDSMTSFLDEELTAKKNARHANKNQKLLQTSTTKLEKVSETIEDKTPKRKTKNSKSPRKKARSTGPAKSFVTPFKSTPLQPTEYEAIPVEEFRHSSSKGKEQSKHEDDEESYRQEETTTNRRSQRARYPPLAYWKNEKLQYGPDDKGKLIVPTAVIRAKDVDITSLVTPTNTKRATAKSPMRRGKGTPAKVSRKKNQRVPKPKQRAGLKSDSAKNKKAASDRDTPFDVRQLPEKYKYALGDSADVWDNDRSETRTQRK